MVEFGPVAPQRNLVVDVNALVAPTRFYDKEPKESTITSLMQDLAAFRKEGEFDVYAHVVLKIAVSNPRLWLAVSLRHHKDRLNPLNKTREKRRRALRITRFNKKVQRRKLFEQLCLEIPEVIALPDLCKNEVKNEVEIEVKNEVKIEVKNKVF